MAMTPYTGETLTIANIGTTPQERAMETSEFKMAFSKDFHEFVEWFNDTHKTDFDAVQTEITSHKADSTAHGASHKNLLHNWDFRNPVNQRGLTSYAVETSPTYTIDRWRATSLGSGTVTVNSGYITIQSISGETYIYQVIYDNYLYKGKTVTFSAKVNGLSGSGQAYILIYDGVSESRLNIASNGYVSITKTISASASTLFVRVAAYSGYSANFECVKLEMGYLSTLANDPPADYGEQLALCQRYYQTISRDPVGMGYISSAGTTAYITVPTPVTMRTTPTLVGATAEDFRVRQKATDITPTAFNIVKYDNLIVLRFTVEGATAREIAGAYALPNKSIALSADL